MTKEKLDGSMSYLLFECPVCGDLAEIIDDKLVHKHWWEKK